MIDKTALDPATEGLGSKACPPLFRMTKLEVLSAASAYKSATSTSPRLLSCQLEHPGTYCVQWASVDSLSRSGAVLVLSLGELSRYFPARMRLNWSLIKYQLKFPE